MVLSRELAARNAALLSSGAAVQPSAKKTGTTIAGVVYKVRYSHRVLFWEHLFLSLSLCVRVCVPRRLLARLEEEEEERESQPAASERFAATMWMMMMSSRCVSFPSPRSVAQ